MKKELVLMRIKREIDSKMLRRAYQFDYSSDEVINPNQEFFWVYDMWQPFELILLFLCKMSIRSCEINDGCVRAVLL